MPRSNKRNIKRKRTKNIFAIEAVATATPVKPNRPAIMEMTKNTIAQYNIVKLLLSSQH